MPVYSVLSLNLAVEYPWDEKKGILIDMLKKLDPDVICFQEILNSDSLDQVGQLTNLLGYKAASFLKMPYDKVPYGEFGQATFWKDISHPNRIETRLLSKKVVGLEEDKLQRSFIATKHLFSGSSVWIINSHFSTEYAYRKTNWKETKEWVINNVLYGEGLILCGDFNTYGVNTDGKEDVQNSVISYGLKDAWALINKEPCITYRSSDWWLENHPNSREALKLIEKNRSYTAKALDFFFVNENIDVRDVQTVDLVNVVSDHLGLYMQFSF